MDPWHDFLVAEVGATAALTGLIFVALSINIARILQLEWLPNRAAQSLLVLMTALLSSSVMLFPAQSPMQLTLELTCIFVISLAADVRLFAVGHVPAQLQAHLRSNIALNGFYYLLSFIGILMKPFEGNGAYVIAFATLYSLCYGTLNAWVLLVEILR